MIRISPKLIVTVGVFFSSFSSIFVRSSNAPALTIALYRMWLSVALLLPLFLREKVQERRSGASRVAPRVSDYGLCVVSGVFLAIHFWTWFEALQLTSIASATVLVDTHPIFVLIFGFLILKERVTRRALAYVLIALAGIALLSFGDLAGGTDTFYGDLMALAGAAAVSGYMLIGRFVRQRMSAFTYAVSVYLSAALSLSLFSLIKGVQVFGFPLREYLIFAGIAFFCTLLGHTLFNWALRYLKTSFISMAVLTEPVYATILGIIIFRELPGLSAVAGGVVILLGVILFVREEGKMRENDKSEEQVQD